MMLRVATWNIREATAIATGEPFRPAEYLKDLRCDIIALQEVPFDESGASKVTRDLKSCLNLDHVITLPLHAASYCGTQSGLAILSRFPSTGTASTFLSGSHLRVNFPNHTEVAHNKGFLWISCSTPAGVINIGNIHMFPFQRILHNPDSPAFDRSWQTVSASMIHYSSTASILCGDFNTSIRALSIPPGSGYSRAVAGQVTHEGFSSDDILLSRFVELSRLQLLNNPSDHLICVADLEVLNNADNASNLRS